MQTTGKKVITRVLGLTYEPCMDTYTNNSYLVQDGKYTLSDGPVYSDLGLSED